MSVRAYGHPTRRNHRWPSLWNERGTTGIDAGAWWILEPATNHHVQKPAWKALALKMLLHRETPWAERLSVAFASLNLQYAWSRRNWRNQWARCYEKPTKVRCASPFLPCLMGAERKGDLRSCTSRVRPLPTHLECNGIWPCWTRRTEASCSTWLHKSVYFDSSSSLRNQAEWISQWESIRHSACTGTRQWWVTKDEGSPRKIPWRTAWSAQTVASSWTSTRYLWSSDQKSFRVECLHVFWGWTPTFQRLGLADHESQLTPESERYPGLLSQN